MPKRLMYPCTKKSPITSQEEVIGQLITRNFALKNRQNDSIEAYPGTSTGAALPPI